MNTLRKHVLIALAVLGMGSAACAAHAQSGAPEGRFTHAATEQQRMAARAEHFAGRQAKLHDALQLTAAQEPAWAAFQAAIKPVPAEMHDDRADWADLPAPARMEKRIAMARQHAAAMETHLAALNTFYAVLTPAQRKAFDAHAAGGMGRMKGGRMHHGDAQMCAMHP